jgi:hypothetical protein
MRRIFVFPILLLFTVGCADTGAFRDDLGGAAAAPRPPSSPVGAATPGPIQVTIQDLQRDLQRVLGTRSAVVNTASVIAGKPAIVVTCTGAVTPNYRDPSLTSVESHELRAKGSSSAPRMVLEGADARGTIYAIYEFSNDYLNVPPLWYGSSLIRERQQKSGPCSTGRPLR